MNVGQESEEAGHQERESDRALQSADRTGAGGHKRWGRGAAVHLGRGAPELEGYSRDGGTVEVLRGGSWNGRRAVVRAAHRDALNDKRVGRATT
jgi:formylglycine-generating enzyme required for sulfatase activity